MTSFQRVKANELGTAINIRAIITVMELLSLLLLLFPSLPCAFSTPPLPISPNRSRSQTSLSMTGGDKRLGENSKLSALLRKSGTGGIVHQRDRSREQCSAPGKRAHSAPALAAPPPAQIKQPGRASWPPCLRPRIAELQAVPPLSAPGQAPEELRAPRRAEHYSDLSFRQAKPEKTSWPVPSLEPDKIPPELQPDISEASAEFHSLWIRS